MDSMDSPTAHILYFRGGVGAEHTLLEDQLDRADAGSWQIAARCTVASSAAHRIAIGDLRVHFVVEP